MFDKSPPKFSAAKIWKHSTMGTPRNHIKAPVGDIKECRQFSSIVNASLLYLASNQLMGKIFHSQELWVFDDHEKLDASNLSFDVSFRCHRSLRDDLLGPCEKSKLAFAIVRKSHAEN